MMKIQESEIVYRYTLLVNKSIFSGEEFEVLNNFMKVRRMLRGVTSPSRRSRLEECLEIASEKVYNYYHPEELAAKRMAQRARYSSYSYRPKRRWNNYYYEDYHPREILCAFRN